MYEIDSGLYMSGTESTRGRESTIRGHAPYAVRRLSRSAS